MDSYKNCFKSFKVLLLILGMVIIFSFAFNTASAADTSQINASLPGENAN